MEWKKTTYGRNYVLECESFYISYNPSLGHVLGSSFAPDTCDGETALCKDRKFYILNGDYRKQYEELFPKGFEACYDFFKQQSKDKVSSWSN